MTASMIITLAIVVLMVVLIISDKLPFGAPALLAAALLVIFQQADIATAFSGFVDKNVIMIMGFMVCTYAIQKTTFIGKLRTVLGNAANRGGTAGFLLLLLAIMAVGNFITGTAYYVLIISIVATIPYNKKLPTSRILLPAALACNASGWLPNTAVMMTGLIASQLDSAGITGVVVPMPQYLLINIIWSAVFLCWALIAHRFLPDRDISDKNEELVDVEKQAEKASAAKTAQLSKSQEILVYVCYVALLLCMVFLSYLPGDTGYAIPIVIAVVLLAGGALNFKEFLSNMFTPVVIMMASVIGVAAAMSNCGLSAFLGEKISTVLGADPGMFTLVLVFGILTSVLATFTGASFGSLFITAPIGIALCVQYGYNPLPLTYACTRAAWINYFMPIDGMPALTMGVGKYKLTEFWKYVLPQWVIQMLVFCGLGCVFFA